MKTLLIILGLLINSCTDKNLNSIIDTEITIKCYSAGTLIYEGKSTGEIMESRSTDYYYYFRELGTDNLVKVSGNCVITYGKTDAIGGNLNNQLN
jgi:hypothetical protein